MDIRACFTQKLNPLIELFHRSFSGKDSGDGSKPDQLSAFFCPDQASSQVGGTHLFIVIKDHVTS